MKQQWVSCLQYKFLGILKQFGCFSQKFSSITLQLLLLFKTTAKAMSLYNLACFVEKL